MASAALDRKLQKIWGNIQGKNGGVFPENSNDDSKSGGVLYDRPQYRSGGASLVGGARRRAAVSNAKVNPWIRHVKAYAKSHGISYGEALSAAKSSYRSGGAARGRPRRKLAKGVKKMKRRVRRL